MRAVQLGAEHALSLPHLAAVAHQDVRELGQAAQPGAVDGLAERIGHALALGDQLLRGARGADATHHGRADRALQHLLGALVQPPQPIGQDQAVRLARAHHELHRVGRDGGRAARGQHRLRSAHGGHALQGEGPHAQLRRLGDVLGQQRVSLLAQAGDGLLDAGQQPAQGVVWHQVGAAGSRGDVAPHVFRRGLVERLQLLDRAGVQLAHGVARLLAGAPDGGRLLHARPRPPLLPSWLMEVALSPLGLLPGVTLTRAAGWPVPPVGPGRGYGSVRRACSSSLART